MFLTDVQSVRSPTNENKRRRVEIPHLPVLQLAVKSSKDSPPKQITALLDSGASSTIISRACVDKTPRFQQQETVWQTANGSFSTVSKTNLAIKFLELDEQKTVNYTVHVATRQLTSYDMIIGRDLLNELGLVLDYAKNLVFWGDHSCPMKTPQQIQQTYVNEINNIIGASTNCVSHILDAKYEKADLIEVSKDNKSLTKKTNKNYSNYCSNMSPFLMTN